MTRRTTSGKSLTDSDLAAIADDFEKADLTPGEVAAIKKTRRREPRIGEARAEVHTFRAPPSYKARIRERAEAEHKSESQVIRDALDAYL